ncbi:MAG: hypothetical protein AAFR90_11765 [Pseudomonadota bacterium]
MSRNNARTVALAASALLALTAAGPAFSSEADREQVKANFQSADANSDDQLDSSEFKTFIDLNADHGIGRASMVRRFGAYNTAFETADLNKDGFVIREEIQSTAANQ